jgi:hypothetical protein
VRVEFSTNPFPSINTDLAVLPILEGEGPIPVLKAVGQSLEGMVSKRVEKAGFRGKGGETHRIPTFGKLGRLLLTRGVQEDILLGLHMRKFV